MVVGFRCRCRSQQARLGSRFHNPTPSCIQLSAAQHATLRQSVPESRPEVGSSRNSSEGRVSSSAATHSRLRSPAGGGSGQPAELYERSGLAMRRRASKHAMQGAARRSTARIQ